MKKISPFPAQTSFHEQWGRRGCLSVLSCSSAPALWDQQGQEQGRDAFSHSNSPLKVFSQSAKARYRNVTICARVQFALGLKVVAVVPPVMPFPVAHRTALA